MNTDHQHIKYHYFCFIFIEKRTGRKMNKEGKNTDYISIKGWAEDERPREKALNKGMEALSDAELIAILLGSGTGGISAVDLAKKMLADVNHDLSKLSRRSIQEHMKYKGIGEAKAITIAASLEIGRRRQFVSPKEKPKVTCSTDIYNMMLPIMQDLIVEHIYLLILNRQNKVTERIRLGEGGISMVVVDPKVVFKKALEHNASSIILVHNHPSGATYPSDADNNITKLIKQAGNSLTIPLLDHVIVTENGYYSYADDGKL
jgi:DNA repair protein RadC